MVQNSTEEEEEEEEEEIIWEGVRMGGCNGGFRTRKGVKEEGRAV
jgi:hypothetical protein